MSTNFRAFLTEIGFKSPTKETNLDWVFTSSDTVRNFFLWLASNIYRSNVLTTEEIQEYAQLLQENKVLEGKSLKEAVASLKSITEEEPVDSIQKEIDALKAELAPQQRKLSRLISQRDKLSSCHASTSQRNASLKHVKTRLEEESFGLNKQIQNTSNEMDKINSQTVKTVSELFSHHKRDNEKEVPYLFKLSLQNYAQNDDAYTRELKRYLQKQFQQGVNAIANEETNQLTWLGMGDSSSFLIKGQSVTAYTQSCKEVSRLQSIYSQSETQLVNSQIELAKQVASFEEAKSQFINFSEFSDPAAVKQSIDRSKDTLKQLLAKSYGYTAATLPALYSEIAQMISTPVLAGDYTLKIARQCYHLSKQERLIALFVSQCVRHKILSMFMFKERQRQDNIYEVTSSLCKQLEQLALNQEGRMLLFPTLHACNAKKQSNKNRDPIVLMINELLSTDSFVGLDSLIRRATYLFNRIEESNKILSDLQDERNSELKQLQGFVRSLMGILYSSPSLQPTLTPIPFVQAQQKLEELLGKLGKEMDVLIRDKAAKNEKLQYYPEESHVKRNLFAWFFTNSEKLKVVPILQKRVEARRVNNI